MPNLAGILYAAIIVGVNLIFRYLAVNLSTVKYSLSKYRRFMTLMCGTGLANATLSIVIYNTLIGMATPSFNAYLYPLIVTNVIIITNIITTLTPFLIKTKE